MVEYVAGLFAGPGDHVESVEPIFHERITLIDGGEHMEDLSCTRCGADIGLDWLWELIRARPGVVEVTGGDAPLGCSP